MDEVGIPDGPRKGESVQGYYVTMVEFYLNNALVTKTEIWEDVRGCVLVIVYHPAGMRSEHDSIRLACSVLRRGSAFNWACHSNNADSRL